jgi:hypothetical protein
VLVECDGEASDCVKHWEGLVECDGEASDCVKHGEGFDCLWDCRIVRVIVRYNNVLACL